MIFIEVDVSSVGVLAHGLEACLRQVGWVALIRCLWYATRKGIRRQRQWESEVLRRWRLRISSIGIVRVDRLLRHCSYRGCQAGQHV